MEPYDAYRIVEHLIGTGQVMQVGDLLGRAFAQGLQAEVAKIEATESSAPDLLAALREYVELSDVSLESLERVSEEFRAETGLLAPGKDVAPEVNETDEQREERHRRWREWASKRKAALLAKAKAAIAKAEARP